MQTQATRGITTTREQLIDQLRGQIRQVETARRNDDGCVISSGAAGTDQLLPAGGYPRGSLVEWLADGSGHSAELLSLLTARNACRDGSTLVIADPTRSFYPPAASMLGLDLANLIVLRPVSSHRQDPTGHNELFWAIEQSLGSTAVGAVWGCLGEIGERWFRRFQLSAECSGSLGLFVRPGWTRRQPSWSDIQWRVSAHASVAGQPVRRISARLLRCRGGRTGKTAQLQINTVTGIVQTARADHGIQRRIQTRSVPVVAQLAHPATGRRTERA